MLKGLLHKKPFITAGVFLLAGVVLLVLGFARGGDPNMNNYALGAFGVLFLIVSAVTFFMYGRMERQYQRLLREEPLLRYVLRTEEQKTQAEKNVKELQEKNKALLMVMLFFCGLFAIVLPFFVEEKLLMIGICLGMGAFLTLAAWTITAYRVRKLRRGGEEVILGRGGAFMGGTFHAWDMPMTGITGLDYRPPAGKRKMGELTIEYTAESVYAPTTESLTLLIPPDLEERIPRVMEALEESRTQA